MKKKEEILIIKIKRKNRSECTQKNSKLIDKKKFIYKRKEKAK